uniref:adhesion G-protein coupled receptor G5-like n=1 Tax=Semicossyphus pulcher TaxID=241346 RepID=UPI0037E8F6E0
MMERKQSWMLVVEIILFSGMFLKNNTCQRKVFTDTNEPCPGNVLLISAKKTISTTYYFPSDVVEVNGRKLCFNIRTERGQKDCCNHTEFNCNFEISYNNKNDRVSNLSLSEEILSKQDIVLMEQPEQKYKCMPSKVYNKRSVSLLHLHDCLDIGGENNIRFSKNRLCGKQYDEEAGGEKIYKFTFDENQKCGPYKPPKPELCPDLPSERDNGTTGTTLETALNMIHKLFSLVEQFAASNCGTANIKRGEIRGMITKLPPKNQTNINFGVTASGISILGDETDSVTGLSRLMCIPKEASEMAVKRNGSFAALLLIPQVYQDDPSSSFLNHEAVGIEMGAEISNLSQTIDIQFGNVDKNGNIASCVSWNGKGKDPVWIKDGCHTNETNGSITCQCSHLTFFAVLLSPPPGNISSSDLTSLTYITRTGCGLSMFFLVVAIFMHCLIRKGKASQATQILMNLLFAMFTLNLTFLVNDKIADLRIFGACVAIAAFMHYIMLATITWFFMEALHLYFSLWTRSSEIKHYMVKMCVTGWVTPAVVVIPFLAFGKYDYLDISADDGTSAKMCWIPDVAVHQGVNVGYYALVFIVTISIFILTLRQIFLLKPTQGKAGDVGSIKTNSVSILGLILLLGITWGFAFFSHGPLLIPSYYIFSILNSFQGFFLFIYYYKSSKVVAETSVTVSSSSSTAISNTYA